MSQLLLQQTVNLIKQKYDKDLMELGPDYRLSDGNSKLKQSGIVSFNLIPKTHCPLAGECADAGYCYAMTGQQAFKSGVIRRARAFLATLQEDFVQRMNEEVRRAIRRGFRAVRIHDSGDFYSLDYLLKWAEIARANPGVKFYAYTKSISLVVRAQGRGLIPDNLRIIQSIGGKEDRRISEEFAHAKIFKTLDELMAAGYDDASETDDPAAFGDNKKIGLVVHGARKAKFVA